MPLLFAITLFVSAALLFAVQPMIARFLLPLLGGAPAVWTTCMVFYQGTLLLGYLYAHFVSRCLKVPAQVVLQFALLAAAFALLPFGMTDSAIAKLEEGAEPIAWLLATLLAVAGLPFFITSTTGPLLQRWFSRLHDDESGDPYFLYSASNLGSLLALAAYPVWLETRWDLAAQANLWRWMFFSLIVLVLACGVALVRRSKQAGNAPVSPLSGRALSWSRRLRWVMLAFVPSSLMLGVTSYLGTDIASIPLLWVIPLSLYLLSFVLVFARRQLVPAKLLHRAMPAVTVILIFTMISRASDPTWFLLTIHLVFFFVAAMVCHGRLAQDRPAPGGLTEYYLWMSIGGALGGFFNGVLAPLLFRDVYEYPLAILAAAALYLGLPANNAHRPAWLLRWAPVLALGGLAFGLSLLAGRLGLSLGVATNALIFGVPVVLCFGLARAPFRFASALALVMAASQTYVELNKRTVFLDRSFFGVSRVTRTRGGRFHQLDHGNTTHGRQFLDPARACEPLAYYHRTGPLGTIFAEFNRTNTAPIVGLIGLGAGAALAYSQPGQHWDIYEIDPLVVRIARTPALFSYFARCSAVEPRVILGDGRLQLSRAPGGRYGLLLLDAFSSDAIPVHLLTEEAVELYFDRVAPGGWVAMHLSNRFLDLEQVISGLAQKKGYSGLSWIDGSLDLADGKEQSLWVLLARSEGDLRGLVADPNRIPLENRPAIEPWTDARSSLLPIFRW
ncbi:MAG TPA: hypothetical protein DCY13_08365 [Verrucomicrobiales bacterium]|nr:hypothetical protein [Verrucomicrobiales bacterium]